MMIVRIFDTETTGMPDDEGKPVGLLEVGWSDVVLDPDGTEVLRITPPTSHFCNPFRAAPGLQIEPGAAAAHHITRDDVADAPSPEFVLRSLMSGADAFAAHNKDFDGRFFTGGEKPFACTLRAARAFYPNEERHNNQYLRYSLNLPVDRDIAEVAHRAGPDSHVTAHLFARMVGDGFPFAEILRVTHAPIRLARMPFGKHRGMAFEEIPEGYIRWLNGEKLDRDLRFTLNRVIKERGIRT